MRGNHSWIENNNFKFPYKSSIWATPIYGNPHVGVPHTVVRR